MLEQSSPDEEDSPPALPTDYYVARWQAGDESAFAVLFRRFAPLLSMRVSRHRVWPALMSSLQVEDAVQEIWARAVPYARVTFKPSGPGSFLALLAKLTEPTLIDLLRRRTAAKRGYGEIGESLDEGFTQAAHKLVGSVEPTPTSHARMSEMESRARELLTEREFTAWWLVEIRGYTSEEVGLAVNGTASAVRGLVMRARLKLTNDLGDEDSE